MKKIYTDTLLILIAFTGNATIIHVPADYATIQEAILSSQDGDTVLVEPGIYYENINFLGHNIVLTSRFYENHDTSFISSTIIDGSNPSDPDTASCIILNSGETTAAVIQGFTIQGGGGTVWYDIHGAGIYREGGGILTEFSSPVIQYNIISNNEVVDETGINGSGGGAIRSGDSDPVIQNNLIVHNHALGYGGAIVINYGEALIRNNIIAYNLSGTEYGGGGIWCTGADVNTVVTVENNTIAYNTAEGSGGGFSGKGGAIFVFTIHVDILNNIIWGNDQTTGGPIWSSGGQIVSTYSDIEGGYTGTGNTDTDPLFGNCFVLSSSSPCIDAGNPDASYNDPGTGTTATYPSQGTLRNDMGAFGGSLSNELPCEEVFSGSGNITAINQPSLTIYPNPLTDVASVSFELMKASHITLEILDANGRLLATLINAEKPAGYHVISFENGKLTPQLSSGVYFLRLNNTEVSALQKIVVADN